MRRGTVAEWPVGMGGARVRRGQRQTTGSPPTPPDLPCWTPGPSLQPRHHLLSASDMMMLGLFPPSSRVTLLRLLLPAATWIR